MPPWLQPAQLYEYPAVEYIPIGVEVVWQEQRPQLVTQPPSLTLVASPQQFAELAHAVGLPGHLLAGLDFGQNLVFLAVGAQAEQCHYRAHKATLVGTPAPGLLQVFQLTRRYFYKDWVAFHLYDRQARELAVVRCQVKAPGKA